MGTRKCGELAAHFLGSEPVFEMPARSVRVRMLRIKSEHRASDQCMCTHECQS